MPFKKGRDKIKEKIMKTKIVCLSIGIIILICIVNVSVSLPTQNKAVRIANSHLEFEKQNWEQTEKGIESLGIFDIE